ncbi:MAG TPA: FAD-dependent oxidoreductase, partial [Mycobacteriales bacterium]|nr:FAD-dependent oxidoreductase [Mycobacteriales bacterium]
MVVGAGPAGAAAAREAATHGVRVRRVDRAEPPRYKCCG